MPDDLPTTLPYLPNNQLIHSRCMEMRKTLWQAECYCTEEFCEGRHYACFWDPAIYGLSQFPEMTNLWIWFHNEIGLCRELPLKKISECQDKIIELVLIKCTKSINQNFN